MRFPRILILLPLLVCIAAGIGTVPPAGHPPTDKKLTDADLLKSLAPSKMQIVGDVFQGSSTRISLPGFFSSKALEPLGLIKSGAIGNEVFFEAIPVSILVKGSFKLGESYSIIREVTLSDVHATYYRVIGEVEIRQKAEKGKYVVGEVVQLRDALKVDDLVVPLHSTQRVVSLHASSSPSVLKEPAVVVGFEDQGQEIGVERGIVILNKGSKAGIVMSQYLPLGRKLQLGVKDVSDQDQELIGYVRIIEVAEEGALALVVKTKDEIRYGDLVGWRQTR